MTICKATISNRETHQFILAELQKGQPHLKNNLHTLLKGDIMRTECSMKEW